MPDGEDDLAEFEDLWVSRFAVNEGLWVSRSVRAAQLREVAQLLRVEQVRDRSRSPRR